jgi:hypothetical protein
MSLTDAEGAAERYSGIGAEHGEFMMTLLKRSIALLLSCSLVLASTSEGFAYQTDQSAASPPPQATQQTPEQLQELVAPIALYPDALVAQILAAATYPAENRGSRPVDATAYRPQGKEVG